MSIHIVDRIDDPVPVRHVLASVSDKRGLEDFVPELIRIRPEIRIFSTGGTYSSLKEILGPSASRLTQVSEYTGQPETEGGLVKTLDFKIYLGLLTETYNPSHRKDLERTGSVPIDLVMVNLYPFEKTVSRPEASVEEARGNIDIGGPCMIRAAAKNFLRVAAVVEPADYPEVLREMRRNAGCLSLRMRFELARKAFSHTAAYDLAISRYLAAKSFEEAASCYRGIMEDAQ